MTTVSEQYSEWAAALDAAAIPAAVRTVAGHAVIDIAGLCLAARDAAYVRALLGASDSHGRCTAFGHERGLDAENAALINGAAAHGEDYDDTFEGTPVHTGAVVIPAVLAACERHGGRGRDALLGIAAGSELMCRMALVAPGAIHRAGFHPTSVIGTFGAAIGVGAALRLKPEQMTHALGIAGSLSAGIIEYLAEGTWTKRLHPGWAAQAGLRAALMGRQGFLGPRTVLEGQHGFYVAFASEGAATDFTQITQGLGQDWRMANIAFKPYACGTMAQPFIDCAIALTRKGVHWQEISEIVCKVGEGTVHRLWEPLPDKWNPSTPYAAKFSVPYCVAVGLIDQAAGLEQFTEERVADPEVRALAARVRYEIDPANEYPRNYSGHIRATLRDGSVHEAGQPHFRGGAREPFSHEDIVAKFTANAEFGGWEWPDELRQYLEGLFDLPDLGGLSSFRA